MDNRVSAGGCGTWLEVVLCDKALNPFLMFALVAVITLSLSACAGAPATIAVGSPNVPPLASSTPSSAQVAESSPAPTPTLEPTEPPTATTVPKHFTDDFSEQSDIWGPCETCEWIDGVLRFGPFPPVGEGWDQIFYIVCEACGERPYYRVAADVAFAEGYGADRSFGLLAGLQSNDYLGAGTITTSQHALYEAFDYRSGEWVEGDFIRFGAVRPGRAVNRVEVRIEATGTPGRATITVSVNGNDLVVLLDRDVRPSKAGLYLGWHSVAIDFDNFEYEAYE